MNTANDAERKQVYWRHRPHPWHGLSAGPAPPERVNAFIEITPFDLMKYELDKVTGYLRVDRPQLGSSLPPTLYGFVPRTYCARHVAELSTDASAGDGDPLDICVITERPINRAEIVLTARVVGVLRTLDNGQADDKILAVMDKDAMWSQIDDVSDLPAAISDRLLHYFSTYKMSPEGTNPVVTKGVGGREEALAVVAAAMKDYAEMQNMHPGSAPPERS
jgi:inorganic pyrophosphatase